MRGEFKADSSCSVLIFNKDNVFAFYLKYEFILKRAWRASGCWCSSLGIISRGGTQHQTVPGGHVALYLPGAGIAGTLRPKAPLSRSLSSSQGLPVPVLPTRLRRAPFGTPRYWLYVDGSFSTEGFKHDKIQAVSLQSTY